MSNARLVQLAVNVLWKRGARREAVGLLHILAQQHLCVRGSHPQRIDADALAPDGAAQRDDVPLVGRDDRQAING